VARYDYADSRRLRLDVQPREVVYHVHDHFSEPDKLCLRQDLGPRTSVVVASNCRYGCDCRKLPQNVVSANITRVDDTVAAA